jgi:hypothetical protein
MKTTELKSHQASIEADQQKMAQLQQDRIRALSASQAGENFSAERACLVRFREDLAARAFIDKTEPDYKEIDSQIAALDQRAGEAIHKRKVAEDALALLDHEISELQQKIDLAERAKLQIAKVAADEWFNSVQHRYLLKGVDDFFQHLAQMEAAAMVHDAIAHRLGERPTLLDYVRNKIRKSTEVVVQLNDGAMHRTSENYDNDRWFKRVLPLFNTLVDELKSHGVSHEGPVLKPEPPASVSESQRPEAPDQRGVTVTIVGGPTDGLRVGLVSS